MASEVATWLPSDCLASYAASEPFARLIADWAEHWFASDRWEVLGSWRPALDQPEASWPSLRISPHGFAILADHDAVLSLALAALGSAEQANYTQADLRVLRRLSSRILDDLETRLSNLPGNPIGAVSSETEHFMLGIGTRQRNWLSLSCAKARLAAIVRSELPRFHTGAPLTSAAAAFADNRVEISAMLGRASLRVGDIRHLEVGDVIMLDQSGDEPLPLQVEGQATTLHGVLAEADGRVVFEVATVK
jgi:hypothetical protein